jgi:hypothetical protein
VRAATDRRLRRVQLQLDVGNVQRRTSAQGPTRPRPIAAAITDFLARNLPAPTEAPDLLLELDSSERATLYRLAQISPLRRVEYEEAYRRRLARQYRRRKTA